MSISEEEEKSIREKIRKELEEKEREIAAILDDIKLAF